MSFTPQTESVVNPGWPKIGRHIGLLTHQEMRRAPLNRIQTKHTCENPNCVNYGSTYLHVPDCMATQSQFECAWCGWWLTKTIILPEVDLLPPHDENDWQRRRVYGDEIPLDKAKLLSKQFRDNLETYSMLSLQEAYDASELFGDDKSIQFSTNYKPINSNNLG